MFYFIFTVATCLLIAVCAYYDYRLNQKRQTDNDINQAIAIAMEYPDPKNQQ